MSRRAPPAAILLALGLLCAPGLTAAKACETGTVFLDADGDGVRDASERGLAGLRVSDGESIANTDSHGRYQLSARDGRTLFLIKPAGYSTPRRTDGLPGVWKSGGDDCDFALRKLPAAAPDAPLEVLVFGDPQPKSAIDLGYYEADIVAPIRAAARGPAAALALSLGDIVNDVPQLYPALKKVDASLGIDWLHVPGNHDVDAGDHEDETSLDGFRAAFGPDTYAWEESRANFLVLDDVIVLPAGGKPYVGGLRASQFDFLEAYLAKADPSRLLVLALHIPLFDVGSVETFRHADRARLFALLLRFPHLLVLSAHTHGQQHYFHNSTDGWSGAIPLHEYNVGAACGSFWSGVKDAQGIPSSTMSDGTPNGYARLSVDAKAHASLRWFAARQPATVQIGLYSPRVLRHGAWPGNAVHANVWMAQADTRVEYRIDADNWHPMIHVLQPDPAVQAENRRDDEAAAPRSYDRLPEAINSTHLWRGALPTDLPVGTHRIEVRAVLDGFGIASATAAYTLADAPP